MRTLRSYTTTLIIFATLKNLIRRVQKYVQSPEQGCQCLLYQRNKAGSKQYRNFDKTQYKLFHWRGGGNIVLPKGAV